MVTAYDSESGRPGSNPEWRLIYYEASITAQGLPEPSSPWGSTLGTRAAEHKGCNWACNLIEGCSLALCSTTASVVSAGICHRNKVNSIAWLYRKAQPKDSTFTLHYITLHYITLRSFSWVSYVAGIKMTSFRNPRTRFPSLHGRRAKRSKNKIDYTSKQKFRSFHKRENARVEFQAIISTFSCRHKFPVELFRCENFRKGNDSISSLLIMILFRAYWLWFYFEVIDYDSISRLLIIKWTPNSHMFLNFPLAGSLICPKDWICCLENKKSLWQIFLNRQ